MFPGTEENLMVYFPVTKRTAVFPEGAENRLIRLIDWGKPLTAARIAQAGGTAKLLTETPPFQIELTFKPNKDTAATVTAMSVVYTINVDGKLESSRVRSPEHDILSVMEYLPLTDAEIRAAILNTKVETSRNPPDNFRNALRGEISTALGITNATANKKQHINQ
jgi:hypothetical protein